MNPAHGEDVDPTQRWAAGRPGSENRFWGRLVPIVPGKCHFPVTLCLHPANRFHFACNARMPLMFCGTGSHVICRLVLFHPRTRRHRATSAAPPLPLAAFVHAALTRLHADSSHPCVPVFARAPHCLAGFRQVDLSYQQTEYTLGRAKDQDLRLDSVHVSNRHCKIFRDPAAAADALAPPTVYITDTRCGGAHTNTAFHALRCCDWFRL